MTRLYSDDVELYDIAFSWDLDDEVAWLRERFGPGCRTVLEPGSGTGRMLEALARAGFDATGIDSSPEMVAFARERLAAAGYEATVVEADMIAFDLGRTFDAAVCPINTLLHLTPAELGAHFERMAAHLAPGAPYLVQVGVFDDQERPTVNEWIAERGDVSLDVRWESLGRAGGREEHRSRIAVTSGPRAGEVIEEVHDMTAWTSSAWRAAIDASPFVEAATYDGGESGRPPVELEDGGGLMWHELRAP